MFNAGLIEAKGVRDQDPPPGKIQPTACFKVTDLSSGRTMNSYTGFTEKYALDWTQLQAYGSGMPAWNVEIPDETFYVDVGSTITIKDNSFLGSGSRFLNKYCVLLQQHSNGGFTVSEYDLSSDITMTPFIPGSIDIFLYVEDDDFDVNTGWFGTYYHNMSVNGSIFMNMKTDSFDPYYSHLRVIVNPSSYTITTSSNPSAGGTTTGDGTYNKDSSITVRAYANDGYEFNNWTENGVEVSKSSNYTFTASSNRNLVANFNKITAPPTGLVKVTGSCSPSNGGNITGLGTYPVTEEGGNPYVSVRAVPNSGYKFDKWTVIFDDFIVEDFPTNPANGNYPPGNYHFIAHFSSSGDDPPPVDPPPSGSGDVSFNPDNTGSYLRGWAKNNVTVTVSIPNYTPQKVDGRVIWTYKIENYVVVQPKGSISPEVPAVPATPPSFDEEGNMTDPGSPGSPYQAPVPANDVYGWVDGGTGTADYNYKQNWTLSPTPIEVTGSVPYQTVANGGSVVVTNESDNNRLQGRVRADKWEAGSFEGTAPSLPASDSKTRYSWISNPQPNNTPRPNITYSGNSGIYKIDKQQIGKVSFSPNQTNSSPGPGAVENWSNQPVTINMSASDNLSGVYPSGTRYTIYNQGSYYTSGNLSGGEGVRNGSAGTTLSQDGIYTISTTSEDYAGWTNSSSSGTYKIDRTVPVIKFSMEERPWHFGDGVSRTPVNVMVSVSDNLSGVQTFKYQWTNTSTQLGWDAGGWINASAVSQNLSQSAEGIWWLHVWIADKAGNRTYRRSSGPYKIDLTAPDSSVNPIPYYNWTNVPYDVILTLNDPFINLGPIPGANDPSLLDASWNIQNQSYYNHLPSPSSGIMQYNKQSSVSIPINNSGAYKIYVTRKDGAGNVTTIEYPVNGNPDQFHDKYLFDAIPPYDAVFSPLGGINRTIATESGNIQAFDFVADYSNQIQVTVGDDLSGLGPRSGVGGEYAWFAWSKSPTILTEGTWNVLTGIGTQEIFSRPFVQKQEGQDIKTFNIYVHSNNQYNNIVTNYASLKEGLWYLHIKQKDRAGNVTSTIAQEPVDVIPGAKAGYFKKINPQPVFVNKLNSLRISDVTDPSWGKYFTNADGTPTTLKQNGIRVTDMPIYANKEGNSVKLGYRVYYKINAVGFNDAADTITAEVRYHALEKATNALYRNVDVYIPNKSGKYIKLENSEYANSAYTVKLKPTNSDGFNKPYEAGSEEGFNNILYNKDGAKGLYSTYITDIYLPPTAVFVTKGKELNPITKANMHDYKILVTFDITAQRNGVPLDYSMEEDTWAKTNVWPDNLNDYGKNRPTDQSVIGKGVNHSEVFWYNAEQTLKDDTGIYRRW